MHCAQCFPTQVTHRHAGTTAHLQPEGLGPCAVTIQCRTTLFPYCRSRLRATTPSPPGFFLKLAEVFAEALATDTWRLPTLADCLQAAAALAMPSPALAEEVTLAAELAPGVAGSRACLAGEAHGAPALLANVSDAIVADLGRDAAPAAAMGAGAKAPAQRKAAAKGKALAAAPDRKRMRVRS